MAHALGLKDDDAVAKQVLFVLGMNSFLGVQNLARSVVGELSLRPELCEQLRQEIRTALGLVTGPVDWQAFRGQHAAARLTLREVLRLYPPVALIFGRALRDGENRVLERHLRALQGRADDGRDPDGAPRQGGVRQARGVDPDRFLEPGASQHLILAARSAGRPATPQGRTCPGKDIAILIAKLFAVTLLMKCEWTSPSRRDGRADFST
jgi:prostaglandin-endoperoxide synthase 2